MALVISDAGISYILDAIRAKFNVDVLNIHLFVNNLTPARTNVLGDFSEANFSGYAIQAVPTWGAPAVASHVATSQPAGVVFTVGVGGVSNNVYGYFVTDPGNSVLYWSERDAAAPITLSIVGQTYTINLINTYESKYP